MECISYKSGYKYQLKEEYVVEIPFKPDQDIVTDYIEFDQNGALRIRNGYAWDGPSGPTIDTLNFMRGSLVHDALYQLMRNNVLDREIYKKPADKLLKQMCQEDGMTSARAWWVYQGVRLGGDGSTHYENKRKIIKAPKRCQP